MNFTVWPTARGRYVLIETYWNVNDSKRINAGRRDGVLIETYWNVNVVASIKDPAEKGLNRNILECKFLIAASASSIV